MIPQAANPEMFCRTDWLMLSHCFLIDTVREKPGTEEVLSSNHREHDSLLTQTSEDLCDKDRDSQASTAESGYESQSKDLQSTSLSKITNQNSPHHQITNHNQPHSPVRGQYSHTEGLMEDMAAGISGRVSCSPDEQVCNLLTIRLYFRLSYFSCMGGGGGYALAAKR